MVVKRPTERVSAPAKAATGSKRPRAGTLSPVDPAFMPTAEGRAHGSSSTPLKAILDDYAEQQQQLTAASGSDDGMVGLHIGFDIPDAEPVGAAAVAQPVAPAAPVAPEIDQGDTTDLEQDGPAQADDEDAPTMTTTDILADQLPAVSPPADLTAEMVAGLKVTDLKAAMTVRAVAFRAEDNKADLVARLTKHVRMLGKLA